MTAPTPPVHPATTREEAAHRAATYLAASDNGDVSERALTTSAAMGHAYATLATVLPASLVLPLPLTSHCADGAAHDPHPWDVAVGPFGSPLLPAQCDGAAITDEPEPEPTYDTTA